MKHAFWLHSLPPQTGDLKRKKSNTREEQPNSKLLGNLKIFFSGVLSFSAFTENKARNTVFFQYTLKWNVSSWATLIVAVKDCNIPRLGTLFSFDMQYGTTYTEAGSSRTPQIVSVTNAACNIYSRVTY